MGISGNENPAAEGLVPRLPRKRPSLSANDTGGVNKFVMVVEDYRDPTNAITSDITFPVGKSDRKR